MTEATNKTATIEAFVVEQIIAMGVEPGDISPDATLTAMGLDSLDVVELSQAVKKHLQIQIVPKDFANARMLSEAVAVILERVEA